MIEVRSLLRDHVWDEKKGAMDRLCFRKLVVPKKPAAPHVRTDPLSNVREPPRTMARTVKAPPRVLQKHKASPSGTIGKAPPPVYEERNTGKAPPPVSDETTGTVTVKAPPTKRTGEATMPYAPIAASVVGKENREFPGVFPPPPSLENVDVVVPPPWLHTAASETGVVEDHDTTAADPFTPIPKLMSIREKSPPAPMDTTPTIPADTPVMTMPPPENVPQSCRTLSSDFRSGSSTGTVIDHRGKTDKTVTAKHNAVDTCTDEDAYLAHLALPRNIPRRISQIVMKSREAMVGIEGLNNLIGVKSGEKTTQV